MGLCWSVELVVGEALWERGGRLARCNAARCVLLCFAKKKTNKKSGNWRETQILRGFGSKQRPCVLPAPSAAAGLSSRVF